MRLRFLLVFLLLMPLTPPISQATPSDIVYNSLTITPKKVMSGENVTILFTIINNQTRDAVAGFIIEHHPPPYTIIDEENMTLKYFQYAKSVSILSNQTLTYRFVLASNYTGVNTVVVSYLGGPELIDTFNVDAFRETNFMGNFQTVAFTIGFSYYIPAFLVLIILAVLFSYLYNQYKRL